MGLGKRKLDEWHCTHGQINLDEKNLPVCTGLNTERFDKSEIPPIGAIFVILFIIIHTLNDEEGG